jgi:hypothetical protein
VLLLFKLFKQGLSREATAAAHQGAGRERGTYILILQTSLTWILQESCWEEY